ncbi:MAG TPA: DegT/DnrJ/EryC1/StrS family aminotransferase [Polyangia bacterium]|jgi:perosamine synthetase|nr:DegT/DnrJ/EryC1/StrS family aminotransferase [Polyangia bacterium]
MGRIPISGPSISEKEIAYVTDAVTNCWYGNANLYHERFQKAFAAYLGVSHAMPLPSCTSALHLALAALGVTEGDEVIVPESTWIASSAPISYVGATPVFADVDPMTWCLSPASVERCLSPRTKAVIAVDLYGNMPDYDALRGVCDRRGIPIIEDAAEAIGCEYHGKRAGALGRVGTFSFHGSKTMTTGEGGMLVTDDEALFKRASTLQDHGRKPGDRFFMNEEVAFKYKMSSMQAALGLAQLERIETLVAQKRAIFRWYQEELHSVDGLTLNSEPAGTKNTYWMVTAIVDPKIDLPKLRLMELLGESNIDVRPFFFPLSSLPAYKAMGGEAVWRGRNPVAYRLSAQAVNLPSALNLTRDDVSRVCAALKSCVASAPRR